MGERAEENAWVRHQLGDSWSAGNKIDLEKKRNVRREMAEEYAESVGAAHIHTSAKTNEGIDQLFAALTQKMMENAEKKIQENRTR